MYKRQIRIVLSISVKITGFTIPVCHESKRQNMFGIAVSYTHLMCIRDRYGSVDPTAIVGPAILATTVSTLTAVVFCKVMNGKRRA